MSLLPGHTGAVMWRAAGRLGAVTAVGVGAHQAGSRLSRSDYGDWDTNWDRREPSKHEAQEDSAAKWVTRHLWFVRHGQYHMKASDEERTLTPLGRNQAKAAGQRLRDTGIKFNKIYYSTMTRARETAEIISADMPEAPMVACDLIREGAPIPPVPPHATWAPPPHRFFVEGARLEAAFRQYVHRPEPEQDTDQHILLVAHGNLIRFFVLRALQLPPQAWLRLALSNCSITRVSVSSDGNCSVYQVGDSGHIPYSDQTYN